MPLTSSRAQASISDSDSSSSRGGSPFVEIVEEDDQLEEEEEAVVYTVEKITRASKQGGVWHYSIKWQGFSNHHNTLEPEANLSCPDILQDFWLGREDRKATSLDGAIVRCKDNRQGPRRRSSGVNRPKNRSTSTSKKRPSSSSGAGPSTSASRKRSRASTSTAKGKSRATSLNDEDEESGDDEVLRDESRTEPVEISSDDPEDEQIIVRRPAPAPRLPVRRSSAQRRAWIFEKDAADEDQDEGEGSVASADGGGEEPLFLAESEDVEEVSSNGRPRSPPPKQAARSSSPADDLPAVSPAHSSLPSWEDEILRLDLVQQNGDPVWYLVFKDDPKTTEVASGAMMRVKAPQRVIDFYEASVRFVTA